ncbi:MAG: hypothetical protein EXR27_13985 [Betaproteobacteria bacterium]|nr:hypothetical protein [Betaproteobacteria bacterium]
MKVTRIHTGKDGEAYFEDVEVSFDSGLPGAYSATLPVERFFFRTFPQGHVVDYHVAPRRQWVIIVSGVIEVDCAGGCRRFSGGDILFMDDLHGRGHITRGIEGTWVLAYLPVPPDFDLAALGAAAAG